MKVIKRLIPLMAITALLFASCASVCQVPQETETPPAVTEVAPQPSVAKSELQGVVRAGTNAESKSSDAGT